MATESVLVAVVLVMVIAALGWLVRYARAVHRGDWETPEGARELWWQTGRGGHRGFGGQTPPLVPYNPYWDPRNRIQ